jgi:cation-transporting ATPase 13A3/4/5
MLFDFILNNSGPPYRKPFYSNYMYLLALLALTGLTSLLLLYPLQPLREFFLLENLPLDFRLNILVCCLSTFKQNS